MFENVLLVDDDEDVRAAVADVLYAAGARDCFAVASLAEVQARAADALRSDLAILDINLGAGRPSGIDVQRWLRDRGYSGTIAFMTGHAASDPRVVAALTVPQTRLMAKPVSFEGLVGLLHGR